MNAQQFVAVCACGCGRPVRVAMTNSPSRGRKRGQPFRFVHGHNGTKAFDDQWQAAPNGCWLWTGAVIYVGYGELRRDGVKKLAHRVAYEMAHGSIPAGHQIDHTCHNADTTCLGGNECLHRRCVNPAHLEAVTQAENILRAAMRGVAAGDRFGKWTLVRFARSDNRAHRWLARCDCGTEREVLLNSLRRGRSRSCGCAGREASA